VANAARRSGLTKKQIVSKVKSVITQPKGYADDKWFGELAQWVIEAAAIDESRAEISLRPAPATYRVWGGEALDDRTLQQMENACRLPITVRGAQMPDGHLGYGLPIGGVVATRNAVIPYGVGVDIACRVKLSVVDVKADRLPGLRDKLRNALLRETSFGIGAKFPADERREHEVMDDPDWESLPPTLRKLKRKAWDQLGSSGSGNHFVEWGEFVLDQPDLGLEPGRYLALLSHSGSRGLGANIAAYYTKVAKAKRKLPQHFQHLAWLDLDEEAGAEYWSAMNLAGRYAHANHACIHKHVLKAAGFKPIAAIENHHNFAWKETHDGEEVIVHRKGATPAAAGELGFIPGTMADPGYVIRGKGEPESLNSSAHGAGRVMSRTAAKKTLSRADMRKILADRGVELLSAGLDESPEVYKPIDEVMAAQSDLVDTIAAFHPRIVRMADDGTSED
jgi:tRNA-splicing ligase RtcB